MCSPGSSIYEKPMKGKRRKFDTPGRTLPGESIEIEKSLQ
jgi:hypothetical protein